MDVIIIGIILIFITGFSCAYIGYKQGELNGFKIGQTSCNDMFGELIDEQKNKGEFKWD